MRKLVLVLFFCASFLYAQDYRVGDDGKFYQILRWSKTNASSYEVEVEMRGASAGAEERGGFVVEIWDWQQVAAKKCEPSDNPEEESIEISLPAGRYRFRIIGYNALGKPGATSDWTEFRIYAAVAPEADPESIKMIEVPKDADSFAISVKGKNLVEGAEVYIVNSKQKNAAPVKAQSTRFSSEDVWLISFFLTEEVVKGGYDIVITNPGGLSQTIPNVPLRFVKADDIAALDLPALYRVGVEDGWSLDSPGVREGKGTKGFTFISNSNDIIRNEPAKSVAVRVPSGQQWAYLVYWFGESEVMKEMLNKSTGIRFKVLAPKTRKWVFKVFAGKDYSRNSKKTYPVTRWKSFKSKRKKIRVIDIPWYKMAAPDSAMQQRGEKIQGFKTDAFRSFGIGADISVSSPGSEVILYDIEIY